MLIDQQFKIITVSASQPPPATSLESLCRADSILQTPCTALCLDIYEPTSQQDTDKGRVGHLLKLAGTSPGLGNGAKEHKLAQFGDCFHSVL